MAALFPVMKPTLAIALLFAAAAPTPAPQTPAPPQPSGYHLQLEATPGAPFPWLGQFGNVTIDVYPNGFRAESLLVNGFLRNGSPRVTVENRLSRVSNEVPLTAIAPTIGAIAGAGGIERGATGTLLPPSKGKVKGIDALRYRMSYGADAWIDLWMTTAIPENPALRSVVLEVVRGISPGTADVASKIHGTPVYVELNFRRFKKLPILKVKTLTFDAKGEEDALKVGTLYIKGP